MTGLRILGYIDTTYYMLLKCPSSTSGSPCYYQGRIEPPKAARGHVTLYTAKCKINLKIVSVPGIVVRTRV